MGSSVSRQRPQPPRALGRRHFVEGLAAGLAGLGGRSAWAEAAGIATLRGERFDLTIGSMPVNVTGRRRIATAVNGSVPGPILRFREGDTVTLAVRNTLREPSSIHWHGILLPNGMDGVPGLTFRGIMPGETFTYRFPVRQSGTYWYHSHSGMQEQTGLYGPLILEPRGREPYSCQRDYVVMLSDWTDEDPMTVVSKLKQQSDYYNYHQRTLGTFIEDSKRGRSPGDRAGPADVGPDAHEPDRHHGCDGRDLHVPHERPAARRQLDGAVRARREGPPALHQRLVDVDFRRAHSRP